MNQPGPETPTRPSGELPTALGWILILVGVIPAFMAGGSRSMESTILGYLIAQLGIGLGVLLVSLGYIVRALWFLPGREIPRESPLQVAERFSCDWCDQTVAAPHKACSMFDPEKLASVAPQIRNGVCRDTLVARGFQVEVV
jgi:hypothetical protein